MTPFDLPLGVRTRRWLLPSLQLCSCLSIGKGEGEITCMRGVGDDITVFFS